MEDETVRSGEQGGNRVLLEWAEGIKQTGAGAVRRCAEKSRFGTGIQRLSFCERGYIFGKCTGEGRGFDGFIQKS